MNVGHLQEMAKMIFTVKIGKNTACLSDAVRVD
jgi:hypothetical protein